MTDWRQLFPTTENHSLEFFPPDVEDDEIVIRPPPNIFDKGTTAKCSSRVVSWTGLSYIASGLGVPLYMDSITAIKIRLAYAKVCVEIEAGVPITDSVSVILKNENKAQVGVVVPWIPPCSSCCKVFGHFDKFCPKVAGKKTEKTVQVWIPKINAEVKDHMIAKISEAIVSNKHDISSEDPHTFEDVQTSNDSQNPEIGSISKGILNTNDTGTGTDRGKSKSTVLPNVKNVKVRNKFDMLDSIEEVSNDNATRSKTPQSGKTFTGSSSKMAHLNSIDKVPLEDTAVDVQSQNLWTHLVENAKITPPKGGTRAASKGVPIAMQKVQDRKQKHLTKAK